MFLFKFLYYFSYFLFFRLHNTLKDYEEEDDKDIEPVSEDELAKSSGYMLTTQPNNDSMILTSTNIEKEWIFVAILFSFGFIPLLLSFSILSFVFLIMVAMITYFNVPQKEIISFNKNSKTITKETKGIRNNGNSKRVHSLEDFIRFSVEQSEKKNGAYRLMLEFNQGITIPMTDAFYISEKAVAQKAVAYKVTAFLKNT